MRDGAIGPDTITRTDAWRGPPDATESAPPFDPAPDFDPDPSVDAPGAPGTAPTWTSSAKDAVGCSLGPSRLWFTLGYGIINEVYYPRVDIPQIRDLGFIVADGAGFWSEVKRVADYTLRAVAPGVPAFEIVHRHRRYALTLRVTPDPRRDVLAIEARLDGDEDLRLYALLAPHLGASGHGNRAAVAGYRGRRVLWAEQGPFALALAAVDARQMDAVGRASAGYVGGSDGWQDFSRNGAMTWTHPAAGPGNVALMAELPRSTVLALGFGSSREAAATLAISALLQPFDTLLDRQIAEWDRWHARRDHRRQDILDDVPRPLQEQCAISGMVLRAHLDKTFPGAMVASLSVPWGDSGDERGGYHLVWPRDLCACASALMALGAEQETRDALRYLIATQNADGHWHQNQWLGGRPFWTGVQLDETGFPVLLAAALAERDALQGIEVRDAVRRALGFIARTGPATGQDRWEENAGVNVYTLAICIAALAAGAALLSDPARRWALALADFWNTRIEAWTAVRDGEIARRFGVGGHYVRIGPPAVVADPAAMADVMPIRNRADAPSVPASQQVSTDFLQLVRFGLRPPDDPLIQDSLTVIDGLLRVDTPAGPVWRRYNGDGYGEHDDGRPFDGAGRGRLWPLLTGERGHYELMAGRDPLAYLATMAALASPGGMLPEQVWDAEPIPARRLEFARPTGSAMPLAWAHAEFVKLLVSRHLGYPMDRPRAVWARYGKGVRRASEAFWWLHAPIAGFPAGARLVVAAPHPVCVRWGTDGWRSVQETVAEDTGLGFYAAALTTQDLPAGACVDFTTRSEDTGAWLGRDIRVAVLPER